MSLNNKNVPSSFSEAFLRLIWGKRWAPIVVVVILGCTSALSIWSVFKPDDQHTEKGEIFVIESVQNAAELIESFELPLDGDSSLVLKFRSGQLDLNFDFRVSDSLTVVQLKNKIINHFALRNRVVTDLPQTHSRCRWEDNWRLTINGEILKESPELALKKWNIKDGSILRIKVFVTNVCGSIDGITGIQARDILEYSL